MFGYRSPTTPAMALAGLMGLVVGCEATRPGSEFKASARSDRRGTAAPFAGKRVAGLQVTRRRGAGVAGIGNASGISLFGELTDARSVPFATQPARGLQQHTFTQEGGDFDPDVDKTGRLLVFASTRHSTRPDIYVKAIGGSAITQLTDDPSSDVQPQVSPDGKRVAFATNRGGNWDIWVTSIDGQNAQQVTKSPKAEVHPSWSPDGQRLVYCALNAKARQWELWVTDLRRPGVQKFIGYGLFPRWSPKDEVIAYQRARARGKRWFSIWTIRLVEGEPRFPTEIASSSDDALIAPAWTTDGNRIVYCAVRTSATEDGSGGRGASKGDVWITDANGGGRICLTSGDAVNYSPVCAPDDRVYFTSNRSGLENIWSIVPIKPPAPVADARSTGGTVAPARP